MTGRRSEHSAGGPEPIVRHGCLGPLIRRPDRVDRVLEHYAHKLTREGHAKVSFEIPAALA